MSKSEDRDQPRLQTRQTSASENMRPRAAANYTGLSESTLAKLRMVHRRAEGPKFIKLSGCVVYRRVDLDEWMEQNAV